MKRLFGTDGIRGVAGEHPLDAPTVRRFGMALAEVAAGSGPPGARVVLGRDTRESGPSLRDAVAAGLGTRGVTCVDVGVITTPGLARIVRDGGFAAGVMISASHNPYRDNGLKAFGPTGTKLPDDLERRIEDRMLDGASDSVAREARIEPDGELVAGYLAYLRGVVGPAGWASRFRVVLDCAHGAASFLAADVFRHHGATVETIGCEPDGRNINRECGSLHLDAVAERVRATGADLGIAFDGDADRALAVDAQGRVADGDVILYLAARLLARRGALRGNAIVATILSNLWLEKALEAEGIALHRAPVGDKYVYETMLAHDLVLGGEQSGHVIFRDHADTGDGMLTGLMLLRALAEEGRSLGEFLDVICPCPQVSRNVRVGSKPDLSAHPAIGPAVASAERALAGNGRIVLRYSGTEPLVRIMIEGVDAALVREHADRLARTIEAEIGAGEK
jgi:phosphoglucosamine mutase